MTPKCRAEALKRPGETWISPDDWLAMDRREWTIVEAIWHGERRTPFGIEYGVWREPWNRSQGRLAAIPSDEA
jgi:hypothetical protein